MFLAPSFSNYTIKKPTVAGLAAPRGGVPSRKIVCRGGAAAAAAAAAGGALQLARARAPRACQRAAVAAQLLSKLEADVL